MLRTPALAAGLLLLGGILGASGAQAQVAHGQVNWTAKTITATGSGAPSLKAANVAVARLGAERAAKMDALRNVIETVKGIRVSGSTTAGSLMESSPETKSAVEGIVRGFKVLDTKYYSDGGVDVIVEVPLDGVLVDALVADSGATAKSGEAGESSGVIINAKGLKVQPALAPRVLADGGAEVYSAKMAAKEAVKSSGVVAYSNSLDAASKDARVGSKPLIIKALKVVDGSDLVVSAEDAAKLTSLGAVLGQAKVIIVTD